MARMGTLARDAAVIGIVAFVTFSLTAVAGYVQVRGDDAALVMRVAEASKSGQAISRGQADAFWAALDRGQFQGTWLVSPAIAVVAGIVGGVLSQRRGWQRAAAGAVPFAWVFSIWVHGPKTGIPLLILYLGMAGAAGWFGSWVRRSWVEGWGRPTSG